MASEREGTYQAVWDYMIITLCCIGTALVIQMFQLPNHFVFGGVTGLSVLLSTVTPVGFSIYNIVINLALLMLGFLCLGRSFGVRTVYVTVLTSLTYMMLDRILPVGEPLTREPFLEALIVTFTIAALAAVLFERGACSGGTDIAAMVLRKYVRINIGQALLAVDCLTVVFSFLLYDITVALLSLVGLLIKVFMVDNVLDSLNLCKFFTIICSKPEPICEYIRTELHRGATVCEARGAYTGETKSMIYTAVRRSQAIRLRDYIHANSPDAFLVITNSSEIIGRGFLVE